MKNTNSNSTINPQDFDIFIGLDVDKKSISLTAFSLAGFVQSQKMPYGSAPLLNYVRRHFARQRLVFAYEAGPTGYGLYDDLVAVGERVLVVAAAQTPRAAGERVKTNRIDSVKLAAALRAGQLKGIRVPQGRYRYLRHLAKLRQVYVKRLTATKLRIKALLLTQGLPFPPAPPQSQWSRRVGEALQRLACHPAIRFALDQLLLEMEFQKQRVRVMNRELRRFCRADAERRRSLEFLMTIPGIGGIVALHVLAAVGDWRLLVHPDEIGCFLGLTPVEHSTGDAVCRGAISRMGDPAVRSKLIEGAWMAVAKDAELKAFYERIRQRHPLGLGARQGIVAVARKLTTRIYAVLKNQRPYEIFVRAPAV